MRIEKEAMKHPSPIIICDTFPPDVGGMAQTARRVSEHLAEDRVVTTVLVFRRDKITRHLDGEVKAFSTPGFMTTFDRQAQFKCDARRLLPKHVEPSFVVSLYMGRPAYMGHLLAVELGLRHHIVCLGSDVNHQFERFAHKWRFEELIAYVDRIGVISPDMRYRFKAFPGAADKIVTLPAGFDSRLFKPKESTIRYDFLFAGRARHVKGLDRLIAAFARVRSPARICCVIPENTADKTFAEECLSRAATDASLHEFTWLSVQTPEQMRELYNSSYFVVVPSRCEGAPHVVLEAMGCNRPVIASNVGRIAEFLGTDDTLFETDEELAALIEAALERKLMCPIGLRDRALAIAGDKAERAAYRRFVGLVDDQVF